MIHEKHTRSIPKYNPAENPCSLFADLSHILDFLSPDSHRPMPLLDRYILRRGKPVTECHTDVTECHKDVTQVSPACHQGVTDISPSCHKIRCFLYVVMLILYCGHIYDGGATVLTAEKMASKNVYLTMYIRPYFFDRNSV